MPTLLSLPNELLLHIFSFVRKEPGWTVAPNPVAIQPNKIPKAQLLKIDGPECQQDLCNVALVCYRLSQLASRLIFHDINLWYPKTYNLYNLRAHNVCRILMRSFQEKPELRSHVRTIFFEQGESLQPEIWFDGFPNAVEVQIFHDGLQKHQHDMFRRDRRSQEVTPSSAEEDTWVKLLRSCPRVSKLEFKMGGCTGWYDACGELLDQLEEWKSTLKEFTLRRYRAGNNRVQLQYRGNPLNLSGFSDLQKLHVDWDFVFREFEAYRLLPPRLKILEVCTE